jgi:3-methyladenine DNA glycosylase AlkD
MSALSVLAELKTIASPTRAFEMQRFFKTGFGEYGHGDVFLGITVPDTRLIARTYKDLTFTEIEKLTKSDFHEARLCGLVILCNQFKKSKDLATQKKAFDFYMQQVYAGRINNWDLVDVSAPTIGQYLVTSKNPMPLLRKLSKSDSLWERRVSMIFTFAFLRAGEFEPTYEIAERLLKDDHDLIHKAVGWMLREMGKRDPGLLRAFLREHSSKMPRTALRYSIEKLPERERKKWLLESKRN